MSFLIPAELLNSGKHYRNKSSVLDYFTICGNSCPRNCVFLKNHMRKTSLFLFAMLSSVMAFAQFDIIPVTSTDHCNWHIKNTSLDSLKVKSISVRYFHHTGFINFSPVINNPGGGKYQFPGTFVGDNHTFQYKTIQISALDQLLYAGDTMLVSTTTNAGNRKDTIIMAGVTVYYSKDGVDMQASIYPENKGTCPSLALFISEGGNNAGIKFGSAASPNIHGSACESQMIAVVFNGSNLKRKALPNIIPHCASGRLWTTYGNAKDEQIYYSFDITSSLGRLQFDSLIEAMSIGDYVALTNTAMIPMNNLTSCKTSLRKIGYDPATFDNTNGYYSVIGKKGAVWGEAIVETCQDSHANCAISIEHSMVAGDVSNSIKDFSSCYEQAFQVLGKSDTAGMSTDLITYNSQIAYPNPTATGWNFRGVSNQSLLKFFDACGKCIETHLFIQQQSYGSDFRPGCYTVRIENQENHTTTTHLLIKE